MSNEPAHESTEETKVVEHEDAPAKDESPSQTRIAPKAAFFMSLAMLFFFSLGTAMPWHRFQSGPYDEVRVLLWYQENFRVNRSVFNLYASDMCDEAYTLFNAAQGTAVLSVGSAFCAFLGSLLYLCANDGRNLVVKGSAGAAVLSAVTWAIMVNVYYRTLCNTEPMSRQGYVHTVGLASFLVGFCLSLVNVLILVTDPAYPTREQFRKIADYTFVAGAGLAVVFATIGTPLSQFTYRRLTTRTTVSLWRTVVATPNRDTVTTAEGVNCGVLQTYLHACETLVVAGIIVSFIAALIGVATASGKFTRKASIITGLLALTLITSVWSMSYKIYITQFCQGQYAYTVSEFEIDAGFGLLTAASSVLIVGVLASIAAAVSAHTEKLDVTFTGVLFFGSTFLSLVAWSVSLSLPMFHRSLQGSYSYGLWTLWDITNYVPAPIDQFSRTPLYDYSCTPLVERFHAAAALGIVAVVTLLFSCAFGAARFVNPARRIPAVVFGCISSALMLICWVLVFAVYHGILCNTKLDEADWRPANGLSLMVGLWSLVTLATVLQIVKA